MELRQYVMIVWKRWWLIALTTVLAGVAAFVITSMQPSVYRATLTLEIDRGASPDEDPYNLLRSAEAIAETYTLQIASGPALSEAIARLNLAMSEQNVAKLITVSQLRSSSMIQISAEHTNPALTEALVSTLANVFIELQTAQQQARYQASLNELDAQVAQLEAATRETRRQIASLGDESNLSQTARVQLAELQTQLSNDQTRLAILLQSAEQFRLAMARYGNFIRVFSPAEVPTAPVGPSRLRNTALALVVGAMIGVGTAFLLDYLDDTIHTPHEAQQLLQINTLAAIPKIGDDPDRDRAEMLVAVSQPLHPAAEAFRDLRTSVRFANLDHAAGTLMVTSPLPGEGKSLVAANLAASLAQQNHKVVLVEADLRRPTVHKYVDQSNACGIVEALLMISDQGEAAFETEAFRALFQPVAETEGALLVLNGCDNAPNPAELLGSAVFAQLLAWLRGWADYVIVDTPPVLSVTDAAVVSALVDATIVVVAVGETRMNAIAQTLERLSAVGARILGLVLNGVSSKSNGYYGYYGYYYPAYGTYSRNNGDQDRAAPKLEPLRSDKIEQAKG